jgi:hypothetical protein
MTTHIASALDLNLRYISVRTQWGCQKISNSIGTVGDRGNYDAFIFELREINIETEYVMAVGNRICLYDEDNGVSGSRKLLYPASDVTYILSLNDKFMTFYCRCIP